MLFQKNRSTFRGLSNAEKVKKLQKITRIPLSNLKTNIAESDFEQDDVSMPICLKVATNENYSSKNNLSKKFDSTGKMLDQQQINKTIQTMTNELFLLEVGRQKLSIIKPNRHERAVSAFSIEEPNVEQGIHQDKDYATKQVMDDFYSTQKNLKLKQNPDISGLQEISVKITNDQNITVGTRKKIERKRQPKQMQTEPPSSQETDEPKINVFLPKPNLTKRTQDAQSKVSKRFSRSKPGYDQLEELKNQKKQKFNRSSQKNNVMNRLSNKENTQTIGTMKRGLMTERMSFQVMPTCQTLQTDLKKRKTIVKNFITFQNDNALKEKFPSNRLNQEPVTVKEEKNQKKKALSQFQSISKNQLFIKLEQGNIKQVIESQNAGQFIYELFTKYRQSIKLLKDIN